LLYFEEIFHNFYEKFLLDDRIFQKIYGNFLLDYEAVAKIYIIMVPILGKLHKNYRVEILGLEAVAEIYGTLFSKAKPKEMLFSDWHLNSLAREPKPTQI
jgi:hypothetical protein